MPQLFWIIPLEGGQIDNSLPGGRPPHVGGGPIYHPGHPDHGLPSQPGHPSNRPPGSWWGGATDPGFGQGGGGGSTLPIYHPGHPDHGLPSQPGHPGNRPPGSGSGNRPGNALPEGEDVEISNELPEVPSEYEDKVVVAIKRPGQEWTVKAYDPNSGIDNTLPPAPEPK